MDMLIFIIAATAAVSIYALITARRAERHTRLQPKLDVRQYSLGPNDFLALTPDRELTEEHVHRLTGFFKDKLEIRVVVLPVNSQLSVIRKLPYGQLGIVEQEHGEVPFPGVQPTEPWPRRPQKAHDPAPADNRCGPG